MKTMMKKDLMNVNTNEWKKIHEYCMKKPCSYESRPFGEYPICYRVAGKIFAQFTPEEEYFNLTLKADALKAQIYRSLYPEVVVRGYHCPKVQQPYWNTIHLKELNENVVFDMIDEAYDEIIKKLTKKERSKLGMISEYTFCKTDGNNQEFHNLCMQLDDALNQMVGKKQQEKNYNQLNQLNEIHDVILIYDGTTAIGCGAYKLYDEETVEIKRVFVKNEYRGKGLAKELIRRLEADARIKGFRFAVLETGRPMLEAQALYKKSGYKEIPNYGPYADLPNSVCMSKKI